MVEVDDDEWMMIDNYLREKIDLTDATPEQQNEHAAIIQILNGYGQEQQQSSAVDQGTAAPGA